MTDVGGGWFERKRAKKSSPADKPRKRRRVGIMALEPRVMYDGAAAATVAAVHHAADHSSWTGRADCPADHPASSMVPAVGGLQTSNSADPSSYRAPVVSGVSSGNDPVSSKAIAVGGIAPGNQGLQAGDTVVFVDSQIADYQAIVAAINPGTRVFVYDGTQDGLHEIAQDLNGVHGLASIDIISHGAADQVQLGTDVLTTASISQHTADLAAIGQALAANGQIDLYGCDVAAAGDGFLDALKVATGRDVAASTDPTGAAILGGNWTLEATTGPTPNALPADPGALSAFDALLANTLTAVQTTTLTGDTDGDGVPDPGETVTTSVVITNNSGTTDATGVSFNETLNGMTQVPGTTKITPIAFDDAYTLVGNTPITINAANGVLHNDIDPDASTPLSNVGLTATSLITSANTHGTVSLNADGSFTYTPTTGFAGTATFQYTAHDAQGLNSNVTGTVTLTVSDPVWYVDNTAAAGGDGSFGHAFQTVAAAFSAAAANGQDPNAAVNDTIFVTNNGTTYSQATGVTLASGEELLGDGSSLTSVNGHTIGASASNAALTVTGNSINAVTLGSGNTVSGINITESGTSGNGIIDAGNVGTLHIIGVGVTTTGTGISLTHGGTVDATGTNTISSSGGTALDVANTTISASNLTFQNISSGSASNTSADGIIIDTTGSSGGLHVTGTGSAGSGGTIQHKTGSDGSTTTGIGIYLNSTKDVQLNDMTLRDFQNFGIYGSTVNGFSLTNSTVNTTSGTNGTASGTPYNEGSVFFSELTGTATITSDTIASGLTTDMSVLNNVNGSSLTLNISGSTFTGTANTTVQELLLQAGLNAGDTPSITANITTSTFTNTFGRGIQAVANGAATMAVNIGQNGVAGSGGTFNGMPAAMVDLDHNSTGDYSFNIQNATFTENVSPFATVPINIFNGAASGSSSTFQGRILHNTITGGNNSGFDGISLTGSGPGTMTVLVDHNTLSAIAGGAGISYTGAQLSATNTANLTITNNTVTMTDPNAGFGIMVSAAASSTAHATVTATISGNTVSDTASPDYRVDSRFANSVFKMPGYTGAAQDLTAVRAFVAAANSTTSTEVSASTGIAPGGTFTNTPGGAATPLPNNAQPLLVAPGGVQPADTTDPTTDPTDPSGQTNLNLDNSVLTQAELDVVVAAAIQRWAATGLSAEQIAYLETVTFSIADLSNWTIGEATSDHVTIDVNAAGNGWYIDPTPLDDSEFSNNVGGALYTTTNTAAAGHVDLLTTVMHELGHELGLGDTYSLGDQASLMYGYIVDGERRLPVAGETAGAVLGSISGDEFSVGPISLGTLPEGKSVTITWQATIDAQSNQLIVNPVNQGTVSSSFPTVNTNSVTTTLDSLSIGDHIYKDADVSSTFNAGDTGIAGVALTLFVDSNHDNVFDAGDTQIATTTTNASGIYSFAGLAPGDYIVRVDASNFTGGALATYKNTSPVTAADPDGNVDNDNDGQPLAGGIVVTKAITLSYNNEPTAGTGNDTNNTLDIGFIQNQPPVLDLDANNSTAAGANFVTSYTEAGSPVALADVDVSVTDPDNTTLKSATVTITNFQAGQDVLAFTANGSTGDIVLGTNASGVLTLTSAAGATFAQWQAALQAVTYANSSQDPNIADRSITVVVDDGEAINHASNTATTTVHVSAVNNAPVAITPVADYSATEQVNLNLRNTGLSVSDVDGESGSETATLSVAEGIITIAAGNSGVTSITNNGTGSVSFSGTVAQINALLATSTGTVVYNDNTDTPAASTQLTLTIHDNGHTGSGGDLSASAQSTIDITAVNDPPAVDLNGAGAGTGVTLSYTENGAATAIAPAGLVSDVDSANFNGGSLSVLFTANGAAQDQLSILTGGTVTVSGATVSVGGLAVGTIVGNVNGVGLVINLNTDDATPAAVSTLIAHIGYTNSSDDPSTAPRSVTFTINDGDGTANGGSNTGSATATINITAVNDAPVAAIAPPASFDVGEGQDLSLKAAGLSISDVDGENGVETVTISTAEGVITIAAGTSGVTNIVNNGTNSVSFDGTLAQIDALLNTDGTSTVDYVDNTVVPTTTSLTLTVHDNGNTGSGGDLTSSANATIHITPVDHAPTGVDDTYTASENTPLTIGAAAGVLANDSDIDGDAITVDLVNNDHANVGTPIATAHGTLTVLADGSFTYIPAVNFSGADSFTYQAFDGTQHSATTTVNLTVDAVAAGSPVLTASGSTVSYTELGSATAIDAALSVAYASNLTSATVSIANGFFAGDTLNFTDQNGITGVYDSLTGVLTLSGSDTAAHYQTALESITFSSTSHNPTNFGSDGGRAINFTVSDSVAALTSNIGTDTVAIIAVDDAPVATTPVAHYSATEQTSLDIKNSGLSVSDVDGGGSEIEAATLSVDEGTLTITSGTSGATVSNSGTSAVTVTGTLAQINALLNTDGTSTVSYIDNSDNPIAHPTLTLGINDNGHTGTGGPLTGSATATIDMTAVNDPPVLDLDTTAGGTGFTTTFTESGPGAAIAGANILVTDPDDTLLKSATVTITNFQAAEDQLAFTPGAADVGDISVNTNSGGVLTLTSTAGATFAEWQNALQAVSYSDSSHDPNTTDRSITVVVDDGEAANHASNTATTTVHLNAVNDPPTLSATGTTTSYTEDGAAVALFSAANVSTVEAGQTIDQLTLTVTNVTDGAAEILTIDGSDVALTNGNSVTTATNGLTASVSFASGTATVTLSKAGGLATATEATVVDGITYRDATENPTAGDRVITLTSIKDSGGTANGGVDTTTLSIASTVTVVPVNDNPVLGGAANTVSYTELQAGSTVDAGITVSDVDSATLAGATVTIGSPLAGDELRINGNLSGSIVNGGNTINYSFSAGVMSLTGADTVADYQAALRLVTFDSTSHDPTNGGTNLSRSIVWQVDDGAALNHLSTTVGSTVDITAVNDAPVAAITQTTYGAQAATTLDLKNTGLSVSDVDGDNGGETITLSVAEGILNVTAGGSGAIVSNSGTATVTINGTVAELNALLNSDGTSTVGFIDNAPVLTTIPLTLKIDDNGHTGGGNQSSTAAANIVFDQPPVLSNAGNTISYTELQTPILVDGSAFPFPTGISVSDSDAPGSGAAINSATVTITGGAFTGDTLDAITTGTGIIASFNGTDTLTLSGPDTMIDYQVVLRSVTFASSSQNPTNFGTDPTRTITWVIKDIDNVASAPVTTTINVTAVNDPALVSGTLTGTVTEAGGVANGTPGTPTATGIATDTDVDNAPNTFQTAAGVTSDGGFGTFSITAGGSWTYTLDNNAAVTQALNNGDIVNDTFSIHTADGTARQIVVTINGANDTAVIGGTTTGSVVESGGANNSIVNIPAATGTLTSADVDDPSTFQPAVAGTVSSSGFGTYALAADGTWTYTLDNNNAAVQALKSTDTITDTFTVKSFDGTTQLISIDIHGANDAPTVTAIPSLTYNANKHLPVQLDPALDVTDPDSATLTGATVTIATGQQPQDVLTFVNQNGISGNFDPVTGVLTLTGNSSVANYKTALESVTFTSTTLKSGQRTITWETDDGSANGVSAAVTTNMTVQGLTLFNGTNGNPGAPTPGPSFTPTEFSPDTGLTTVGDGGGHGDFNGDGVAAVNFITSDVTGSTDANGLFQAQVRLIDLEAPLNGDVSSIFATQADGDPLPDWLHFDPSTGIFTGRIPPDAHGILTVQVIVRDSAGHESVMQIKFDLSKGKAGWNLPIDRGFGHDPWTPDQPAQPRRHASSDLQRDVAILVGHTILPRDGHYDAPVLAERTAPAGRSGLSDQLRNAGWHGMNAQRMALLESLRQSSIAPN